MAFVAVAQQLLPHHLGVLLVCERTHLHVDQLVAVARPRKHAVPAALQRVQQDVGILAMTDRRNLHIGRPAGCHRGSGAHGLYRRGGCGHGAHRGHPGCTYYFAVRIGKLLFRLGCHGRGAVHRHRHRGRSPRGRLRRRYRRAPGRRIGMALRLVGGDGLDRSRTGRWLVPARGLCCAPVLRLGASRIRDR